ncbi:non-hydrolyzing UDP-N-acetylglucosamine 2-epimerase [Vibrio sp. TRT 21S02]|uniref:non-hydrolyzing UDP-N-acetylglucosamine 2-epimerase n=1 Tax=Vibrio sp. TRT 21S02 TaxID=3418507 RepID=UPI003CE918D0
MAKDVLIVTGTRPEIIKMAPVYKEFKAQGYSIEWCHTGQHDTLAEQTFDVFGIAPDYVFSRPEGNGLTNLLAGLMKNIESVIQAKKFDCVLVHGDTSSTLAGALTAFYNQVPFIGHVEAGLRSGNMQHPFPEESNRTLVAQIANLHFAPTKAARDALLREGIPHEHILVTGNTAVDAQQYLLDSGKIIKQETNTVLVTAHRRENWASIPTICSAIKALSAQKPELEFVLATHPNPVVKEAVLSNAKDCQAIKVVEPLDYMELQQTLAQARLVLTDSGGIQEEAPTFGTKVVVLRETTERPEAVNMGLSQLAGATDVNRILNSALALMDEGNDPQAINPYGDGQSSSRIVEQIKLLLN